MPYFIRSFFLLFLTLIIVTTVVWLSHRTSISRQTSSQTTTSTKIFQPRQPIASAPTQTFNHAATVPRLRLDEHGHLIIDRHLRLLFDAHHLHAPTDPNEQRLLIQQDLRAQLSPADVTRAMEIFTSYQHYQEALALIKQKQDSAHLNSSLKIMSQQAQIDQLRERTLGAEIDQALFPQAHEVSTLAVDQLSILQNPNLSPQERIQQLSAMQNRMQDFAHKHDQVQSATPSP